MSILEVNNITVKYLIGDFKEIGVKDFVLRKIKGTYSAQEFTALNGISFYLEKGDFLGILGANGAGKSTMLKVISQIMRPTEGSVRVDGNIAALLELGSGFDGNMTIRENVFLRGALMGYTKEFITQKYDEIIDFAELRNFENWFFRQLSSGMRSRLAFSIACFVHPDVLILDEVLSVGDGAFRTKSENKMKEIISSGVVTLFVSHSVSQVRSLSTKVLWLDKGKQVAFGEPEEICDNYEAFLKQRMR